MWLARLTTTVTTLGVKMEIGGLRLDLHGQFGRVQQGGMRNGVSGGVSGVIENLGI